MKIRVLGGDREAVGHSVIPDRLIGGTSQSNLADVGRARIDLAEARSQAGRQVLIEQELHLKGTETSLRSRSAANARRALMSSRVRSGKSF